MVLRTRIVIFVATILVIACTLIACAGSEGSEAPADLVVLNGTVLTVDSEFSTTEAVAIRDNVFIGVGSNDEVQEYIGERTRVIDARGNTVIPGLIETHAHATSVVRREYATPHPYEQLGSIGEIQDWLRTQVENTPEGHWIQLPRTDVTRIQEGRIPNPEELNEAAPDHPAVFNWQYANYQIQVLNSAAVEAAGITANTPVPEGGEIELGENGVPTGVLINSGRLIAGFLEQREIPEDRYLCDLERLLGRYNEVGITSIFERSSNAAGYHSFNKLKEDDRLPVRVTVTIRINPDGTVEDTERVIRELPFQYGDGDERVRVGPLKFGVDGGILYGTAFMREPYSADAIAFYGFDDPDHRGSLRAGLYPESLSEWLENVIRTGHQLGWQMSAHVTGDAGVDAVLDAIEVVKSDIPDMDSDHRFTLIHAYFANRETAERVARLGVGIDTQPAWFYKDGDALARVLASDRMSEFIGLREWHRAGAKVAINTDHMYGFDPNTSLNPYNPFLTMFTAISRQTEGGQVIAPEQTVSREDALRMMTIDAAWLSFDENRKGSIEVGKLGDLAILSEDLMAIEKDQIKDIYSLLTVVGGKVVHKAGNADMGDSLVTGMNN